MKTLHNYLARELGIAVGMAVGVFTFALLFGQVIQALRNLLEQQGVLLISILKFVPLLLPSILTFALPMGLMTALLLVFGKLSADRELMALRASGLSLRQLVWPAYLVATGLTIFCIYLNTTLAPWCKEQFKVQILSLVLREPEKLLKPGATARFGNILVFVGKRDGTHIENIIVHRLNEQGQVLETLRAKSGTFTPDVQQKKFFVELRDVKAEAHDPNDPTNLSKIRPGLEAETLPLDLDATKVMRQNLTRREEGDLTFSQLLAAIEQEKIALESGNADATKAKKKIASLKLEAQERFAWAAGCLVFALIGVPLGIRAHRSETSINAAIALLLIAPYYFLTYWSGRWKEQSLLLASIWLWAPNILFTTIGAVLLWRAGRK